MYIDYSTLIFTLGAIAFLIAVAFAYYHIQVSKKEWNITLYLTAKILQIFSGILYGLQGVISDSISVLAGSFLLILSFCFEILSVTAFDKKLSKRLLIASIVHFTLFVIFYSVFHKNYLIASQVFSFFHGFLAISTVICLYYKKGEFKFPLFLAMAYLIYGLSQLFRFTYLLFFEVDYDFLRLEWYDLQTVIATLVLLILSPFGFLMAIKEVENKELFVAHRLNKAAIDQSPVPIIITDLSANIVYLNPSSESLTGFSKEELLGKNPGIIKSGKTPENNYKALWNTITNKMSWKGEFVNRRKNGEIYYEEATISPLLDEKGNAEYYIAIKQDITTQKKTEVALRESEQRLKAVFDNTITGISIIDKAGYFIYSNETSKNIHGHALEDLVGKHFINIVYKTDLKAAKEMFTEALRAEKDFFQDELRIIHKDSGEPVWVQLNVSLSKNEENNKVESITVVYQDISRLKENQKMLHELNATKDRFFKIVAHDLKNPLMSIIGLSEVLVENYPGYNDKQRLELIRSIFNTGQSTHKLLENLLEWSQAQTGRIQFNPQVYAINKIIDEVKDLYGQKLKSKNLVFKTDTEEDFKVLMDRDMIFTVVRNLVSNAVKFTPRKGTISIKTQSLENDKIKLSVSDTGTGIPASLVPDLFQIDRNVSKLGTENEKGTGIGLILCKEFVDKHEGNLSVESKLGEGSIFSFTLPLA